MSQHVRRLNKVSAGSPTHQVAVDSESTRESGTGAGKLHDVVPLADDPLLGGVEQLLGCTTVFEPGWEADAFAGNLGLCRPMQKDVYGCSADCWWPAQVPDELSNYQGWSEQCSNVENDWSKLTFIDK